MIKSIILWLSSLSNNMTLWYVGWSSPDNIWECISCEWPSWSLLMTTALSLEASTVLMCNCAAAQTSQSSHRKTSTLSDQRGGGKYHSGASTARNAVAEATQVARHRRSPVIHTTSHSTWSLLCRNIILLLDQSPVSIQTQSLALRISRNKRKCQPIGMLGRNSGNHDWLLATKALAFLAVFVYATHATQAIAFEWKPG